MSGLGFSASGVSKSFSFVDKVSGTITTSDSSEEKPKEEITQEAASNDE